MLDAIHEGIFYGSQKAADQAAKAGERQLLPPPWMPAASLNALWLTPRAGKTLAKSHKIEMQHGLGVERRIDPYPVPKVPKISSEQ